MEKTQKKPVRKTFRKNNEKRKDVGELRRSGGILPNYQEEPPANSNRQLGCADRSCDHFAIHTTTDMDIDMHSTLRGKVSSAPQALVDFHVSAIVVVLRRQTRPRFPLPPRGYPWLGPHTHLRSPLLRSDWHSAPGCYVVAGKFLVAQLPRRPRCNTTESPQNVGAREITLGQQPQAMVISRVPHFANKMRGTCHVTT